MYYSLYKWIGEHEITKLKKLLRMQEKGHKNKRKKTRMKWNDTKWTIWYFQKCACVNAIYFASIVTTTYRMKNNKSSTRGLSLELSVLARARAKLLKILYISTHLSVPHGENILKLVLYTPISKNVVGENGEWQLSNGNCTTERNCGFHI